MGKVIRMGASIRMAPIQKGGGDTEQGRSSPGRAVPAPVPFPAPWACPFTEEPLDPSPEAAVTGLPSSRRPSTTSCSASCSSSASPSARASSALALHCRVSATVPGPETSPTAPPSCCQGGSCPSPSPKSTPWGPEGAEPTTPCFGSHADTAPAWFGDFANGLLTAQKLAAALIVLHTGEGGSRKGASDGWWGHPGDQALGHGVSDTPPTTPFSPVFISVTHVHRTKPLWRKSPLTNIWWSVTVPVV